MVRLILGLCLCITLVVSSMHTSEPRVISRWMATNGEFAFAIGPIRGQMVATAAYASKRTIPGGPDPQHHSMDP